MTIIGCLSDVLTLIVKKEQGRLFDEAEWAQKVTLRRINLGTNLINEQSKASWNLKEKLFGTS
jgi:hypothetical protein